MTAQDVLLLLPLLVGAIWTALGHQWEVRWVYDLTDWFDGKYEESRTTDSKISRWGLRPVLWPYRGAARLADRFLAPPLASGLKVAAWLYVTYVVALLTYYVAIIGLVLVAVALGLWVLLWAIGLATDEDDTDRTRHPTPKERLDTMREGDRSFGGGGGPYFFLEQEEPKLAAKFGDDFGRVDDNGKIYSSGPFPVQIGFIADDGTIYDTRGITREDDPSLTRIKVGEINEEGKIE